MEPRTRTTSRLLNPSLTALGLTAALVHPALAPGAPLPPPAPLTSPIDFFEPELPSNSAMFFSVPGGRFVISNGHWSRQEGWGADWGGPYGGSAGSIPVPSNIKGNRAGGGSRGRSTGGARRATGLMPVPVVIGSEP